MARRKDGTVQPILVRQIYTDNDLQPRCRIDLETVREYAEAMKDGSVFPPVVVFFDGSKHWLADGNHRVEAYKHCGETEIPAVVYQGTKRDAILFSVGANSTHGVRRSQEDKRRAVLKLLSDSEWCLWEDSELAKRAGVSKSMVTRYRAAATELPGHSVRTRITESGQLRTVPIIRSETSTATVDSDQSTSVVPAPRYRMPQTPLTKKEIAERYLARIAKHLRSTDKTTQTNIPTEIGVIDLATSDAIYCFVSTGSPDEIDRYIGRMLLLRQCHNPASTIVFVGYFTPAHGQRIRLARSCGFIEFSSPEEIMEN